MKRLAITASFCVASIAALANSCPPESAIQYAESFYRSHKNFYFEDPSIHRGVLSKNFSSRIRNHFDCQARNGMCHIDYDPWLGAQDGDIGSPMSFDLKSINRTNALVAFSYTFLNGKSQAKEHIVQIRLIASKAAQCWEVDDLITPLGQSLSHAYGKPY